MLRSLIHFVNVLYPFAYMYLGLGALLRVILWITFRSDSKVTASGLVAGLGFGILNDTVQLVYLLMPLALLMLALPHQLLARATSRLLLAIATWIWVLVVLTVSVAEILFWEEFESRFNLIAVDYLIYPTEVLGNIWESYPMPVLLTGLCIGSALLWLFLWSKAKKGYLRSNLSTTERISKRTAFFSYASLILPFAFFFSAETFSVSSNRAVNELSKNGIASFFRAALSQEIEYHHFYKTLPSDRAFQVVRDYYSRWGAQFISPGLRNLAQHRAGRPEGLGKLNVVLLVQESLGAQFVGAYGDTRGLTPFLDSFAKESLMFRNAYATGTRTVRGLEAIVASFPPIPSESIVKRSGCENISTWGAVMRQHGYQTSFMYGGYGAFDNMNTFFGGNGFNLSDRLDIKNPRFSNIWGVSDEDLYSHAINYFDTLSSSSTTPFFSVVLSTSNHKPFTFREGVPGVSPNGGGRHAGVRYADFSIGEFFRAAKERPWFSNTLFVVIADHDSRVYGRAYIPVERYRIPVFIHAPGKIAPEINAKIFSSMDLAPTVLSLLGLEYTAPFYGVDALDSKVPAARPVMFSLNHNIAWYENENLTVLGLNKEVKSFKYSSGKTTEVATDEPAADLLAAHLQTAYELFKEHKYSGGD